MNDGVHLNPIKPPSGFRGRLKRVWKKNKDPNGSFQQHLSQERDNKKEKSAQSAEENKDSSAGSGILARAGAKKDPERPARQATGQKIDIRA